MPERMIGAGAAKARLLAVARRSEGGAVRVGQWPRRADRISLDGEVSLRRSGKQHYRVHIFDASPLGCRIEFVERPSLDERVWVKFEGLDALEALVCWVEGFVAGVEFVRPIHPAVFDRLVGALR